ncbi:MAG: glycosyltransferase, partial [Oscillospiraceae bacterium]|nr:glycosyltransferase [Oscillospiraceae bacterium]
MKKVCIFCESWENGGIEAYITNVLEHMDLSNIYVDLVVLSLKHSVYIERLKALGVGMIHLRNRRNIVSNLFLFSRLLNQNHYDVVYLNIFHAFSLVFLWVSRINKIQKRIAHSHNNDIRKSRLRPLKILIHRCSRWALTGTATDLWACSQAAADFMFDSRVLREKRWSFIPNGIEISRFSYCDAARKRIRAELGVGTATLVGNIGRLCQQKNQDFLIDVFALFHNRVPDSYLLLVGEGGDIDDLKRKVATLGLTEKVIFYGTTDMPEDILSAMDFFVFPSLFEGLGIAAVEAQASGLITLCSENIPEEACVSSLFCRKKLEDGAESWANALISCPFLSEVERKKVE